jgi:sugar porter (SP) family MFS transporter
MSRGSTITPYLICLVFITTLGPLQFGYHLAELNAPQAVLTCQQKSITSKSPSPSGFPQCIPMSTSQFGLVSSIYTLGGLLGALLAGPISTKYGRLVTLRWTTFFFLLGSIAESLASSILVMSIGRLLSGVGAGASIVVGPIYISEIAPTNSRGFFGTFTQVMTNVGILITQTLGYFLSKGSSWRLILAIAAGIASLELLSLAFVVESPVWLAEHQQPSQARQVLQRIRGNDADIEAEVKLWRVAFSSENVAVEEESLVSPPSGNVPLRNPPVTILGALLNAKYRPAIIAVIIAMLAQQFTGINSIIMYSVSLLQNTLSTGAPLLAVIISALNLVVTLACSPLPDKIGRKTCLLLSITGMGLSSILLALGISVGEKTLSAASSLLFVACFAVGLGPVPFILASELVGPEAVGATQSWALAANWIATFLVAQFFPMLNDMLGGGKVYWLFAASAGIFGVLIYWRVPETKGKATVEEVWGRQERRRD